MKDSQEDITPDSENSFEGLQCTPSFKPYYYPSERSKFPVQPTEKRKWIPKNDPSKQKRNLKPLMESECHECTCGDSKEIRECSCYGCPFWSYRKHKTKLHRALIGQLRKNESFSMEEAQKLIQLKQSVHKARAEILKKADKHCSRQLGFFERAYEGKSRASAITAYKLYMVNFDLSEVEPLEGGSL